MRISRLAELAYVVEFDSAVMGRVDFGALKSLLPGLVEYAPAYDQVALFFEGKLPETLMIEQALQSLPEEANVKSTHLIPICFELGADFFSICIRLGLTQQDFKAYFLNSKYQVEAVGFTPGFPYMSGLHEALCKLQRLASPRARVPIGAIGIAESMCGIYPAATPGGWNLVGCTPLMVTDMSVAYFRFQVGDLVRFEEINLDEFESVSSTEAGRP